MGSSPSIDRLGRSGVKVNLAVSLNATTDEVRDRIMPVNRRYPIKELLAACRRFPLEPRRRITFEYVLLKGVNDTKEDALRLARLLRGIKCKVNLIPFNPFPGKRVPTGPMTRPFADFRRSCWSSTIPRRSANRAAGTSPRPADSFGNRRVRH